jgi:hypothetical protein
MIDNLIRGKIFTGIHFIHVKTKSAREIYHELYTVYSQNAMNERTLGQWCRMFKAGQTCINMKSEVTGYP